MQRKFTVEIVVDFADRDKLEPLEQVLIQMARHGYATAQLLSDTPKTTAVVVYSDDFYHGHKEIAALDDTIGQGIAQITAPLPDAADARSEETNNELLAALTGGV